MAKRDKASSFLRKNIGVYCYGEKKLRDGEWKWNPLPTPHAVRINRANDHPGWRGKQPYLSNAVFASHYTGERLLYSQAAVGSETALVMIDIDCHDGGTYEGAVEFAAYFLQSFPFAWVEDSTHGRGAHAFLRLYTKDLDAHAIRRRIAQVRRIAVTLAKSWIKLNPGKITGVEVMGDPDILHYEMKDVIGRDFTVTQKRQLVKIDGGTWFKVPRDPFVNLDRFLATEIVTHDKLVRLETQLACKHECDKSALDTQKPNIVHIEKTTQSFKNPKITTRGSLLGCVTNQLISIDVVKKNFPDRLNSLKREVVLHEDWQVFLTLLIAFRENPSADGTLAMSRLQANWTTLYKEGVTKRGWSHRRIKTMRDYLTKKDLLDWVDNLYCPNQLSPTGRGYACKWHANEILLGLLQPTNNEWMQTERDPCGNKPIKAPGIDKNLLPFVPPWGRPTLTPKVAMLRMVA